MVAPKLTSGRRAFLHASVGGIIGYIILHPVAMFIKDIAESPPHVHWDALHESFTFHHLPMALYFVMFGCLCGLIHAFYIHKMFIAKRRIKLLEGLLPICANCKRIREDGGRGHENGQWTSVESYVSKRSEAKFSHGVCPDCLKKLYPEFVEDTESSKRIQ